MDDSSLCGGSLVSTTAVLTAAHCTQGFKKFLVMLGVVNIEPPDSSHWAVLSSWAIEHPDYRVDFNALGELSTVEYDVALIFLPRPAPLTSLIKLVDLPSIYEVHNSFVGRYAIISGWGATNFTVDYSPQLQWTDMKVIPNDICQTYYHGHEIRECHLCARSAYSAVWKGDSGGGLVLRFGKRYKQIGIASYGSPLWQKGYPAVFARVTSVIDWIKLKS